VSRIIEPLTEAELLYNSRFTAKLESCVQIADRCAPWKISNGAQKLVLHALQFEEADVCH
jgi:hypothetical protein